MLLHGRSQARRPTLQPPRASDGHDAFGGGACVLRASRGSARAHGAEMCGRERRRRPLPCIELCNKAAARAKGKNRGREEGCASVRSSPPSRPVRARRSVPPRAAQSPRASRPAPRLARLQQCEPRDGG
eukprot:360672-Chlamydomonas_euryale.AAC.5